MAHESLIVQHLVVYKIYYYTQVKWQDLLYHQHQLAISICRSIYSTTLQICKCLTCFPQIRTSRPSSKDRTSLPEIFIVFFFIIARPIFCITIITHTRQQPYLLRRRAEKAKCNQIETRQRRCTSDLTTSVVFYCQLHFSSGSEMNESGLSFSVPGKIRVEKFAASTPNLASRKPKRSSVIAWAEK